MAKKLNTDDLLWIINTHFYILCCWLRYHIKKLFYSQKLYAVTASGVQIKLNNIDISIWFIYN